MSSASRPPTRPFTRPAYPTLQSSSSTASSSYQSCSSLSTLNSPSPSSAPLPSPSAAHPSHQGFFGSLSPQQQQQSQAQQQPQQHYHPSNASIQRQPSAYEYRPERAAAGRTAAETNNLLNEYALLAEAAKRAQMACLMRDMEGVEL